VLTQVMRVSTQRKLVLSNAADGAALLLASRLSSIATALIHQYWPGWPSSFAGLGPGDHPPGNCSLNWFLIAMAIILLASFAVTWWASFLFTIGQLAVGTAVLSVGTTAVIGGGFATQYMADLNDVKQFQGIGMYLQSFTMEQQLVEEAMQYAAFAVIDDLELVPDLNDDNMNGLHGEDTNGDGVSDDRIRRVVQTYYNRLRAIPSQSNNISNFLYTSLATPPPTSPPSVGTGTGFVFFTSSGGSITNVHIPDPLDPTGAREFKEWLRGNYYDSASGEPMSFIEFLNLMTDASYPADSTIWTKTTPVPGPLYDPANETATPPPNEVYKLVSEITEFEAWTQSILQRSPTELLVGFNVWYSQLIAPPGTDPEDPANKEDWRERLQAWSGWLGDWITDLRAKQALADNCLANQCTNYWTGCCCTTSAAVCGGPACTPQCCASYDCSYACPTEDEPDKICPQTCCNWYDCLWQSCCDPQPCCSHCNGACNQAHCCTTCCLIKDANSVCGSETTIIPYYINHLQAFKNKLDAFITNINNFETIVNTFNANNSLTHTWLYSWHDSRGDHSVKITIGVPGDFRVPYMGKERHWLGFQTCTTIKNHHGNVKVVIQRYDNEPKTGLRGILDLLRWNKTITSVANAEYDIWKDETATPGVKLVEPHL